MALVYSLAYHHHDQGLLAPVWNELSRRGHNIVQGNAHFQAFLESKGPRVTLLVSDLKHPHHAPGQEVTRRTRDAGLRSVTIQHGIPLHAEKHEYTADVICIWGDNWKGNFLTRDGEVVTGDPALDYLQHLDWDAERERSLVHFGEGPWALMVPGMRKAINVAELEDKRPHERAELYIELAKESKWDGKWMVRPHLGDLYDPTVMQAYDYICRTLPAVLRRPDEWDLKTTLFGADLVMGTSTVVFEALAYKCKIKPVAMPFAPKRPSISKVFYKLDGKAAERVADVVEENIV